MVSLLGEVRGNEERSLPFRWTLFNYGSFYIDEYSF